MFEGNAFVVLLLCGSTNNEAHNENMRCLYVEVANPLQKGGQTVGGRKKLRNCGLHAFEHEGLDNGLEKNKFLDTRILRRLTRYPQAG